MHQQPLQAPFGPNRSSSAGQSRGMSGRMVSFRAFCAASRPPRHGRRPSLARRRLDKRAPPASIAPVAAASGRQDDARALTSGPRSPRHAEAPTRRARAGPARPAAAPDAVSYMPPAGRLSLIIKLVGTDQDRLTRPGDRGLFCYTDRLSYQPGDDRAVPHRRPRRRATPSRSRGSAPRARSCGRRAASGHAPPDAGRRATAGAAAGRTASASGSRRTGGPATTR